MADISQMKNYKIKIIFIIHFVLICLSSLGFWVPSAYMFYNFLLIICLLWAIHWNDSEEPIQIAFVVNVISVILDIIVLSMNFPNNYSGRDRFSAAMAIIHLIFRPFTVIAMGKVIQEKLGTSGPITDINNLFPGGRTSYEDIDRTHTAAQPSQGGYNFETAQQI